MDHLDICERILKVTVQIKCRSPESPIIHKILNKNIHSLHPVNIYLNIITTVKFLQAISNTFAGLKINIQETFEF